MCINVYICIYIYIYICLHISGAGPPQRARPPRPRPPSCTGCWFSSLNLPPASASASLLHVCKFLVCFVVLCAITCCWWIKLFVVGFPMIVCACISWLPAAPGGALAAGVLGLLPRRGRRLVCIRALCGLLCVTCCMFWDVLCFFNHCVILCSVLGLSCVCVLIVLFAGVAALAVRASRERNRAYLIWGFVYKLTTMS